MTFYVENETDRTFPFDVEAVLKAVGEEVLAAEACAYEVQVNILLTDNEGIRECNRQCRQIDKETDVLSFPSLDFIEPGSFEIAGEQEAGCFDPDTGELVLGDIMISLDKVVEQAAAYGHSEKREMAFLMAHSMFHLCGYDHYDNHNDYDGHKEEESGIMEEKQESILAKLGITRE